MCVYDIVLLNLLLLYTHLLIEINFCTVTVRTKFNNIPYDKSQNKKIKIMYQEVLAYKVIDF